MNLSLFIILVLSYLYGSIPFALVIGLVFYRKDIRKYGSGNPGGSNAGRVLGKKAGLISIILDISKCFVVVEVTKLLISSYSLPGDLLYLAALACIIGHCYPIFLKFKGGKAVSVFFGYLLATNPLVFAIVGIFFLTVLKISKYVSLASTSCALFMLVVTYLFHYGKVGMITNILIVCLLIYKHRSNIKRLKDKTENKITWM